MSIGLCIDFATHVGYRIYRSRCVDPDERISDALGAIGFPVVQGGVSTFLAIVVMMLVPSNVVRLFARTNVLVVATGLFHGLFLLPIIVRSFASEPPQSEDHVVPIPKVPAVKEPSCSSSCSDESCKSC